MTADINLPDDVGTVLIAGCADGNGVAQLCADGYDAYGIDISRPAVNASRVPDRVAHADARKYHSVETALVRLGVGTVDCTITTKLLSTLEVPHARRACTALRDATGGTVIHRVAPHGAPLLDDHTTMVLDCWANFCDPDGVDVWADAYRPLHIDTWPPTPGVRDA